MAKSSTAVKEANQILRMSRTERRYNAKHRRRKHDITIPIAVITGFVPFIGGQITMWNATSSYGFGDRLKAQGDQASLALIGFNPQTHTWDLSGLKGGTIPIAAGVIVHMIASKTGLNRIIKRATKWFVI